MSDHTITDQRALRDIYPRPKGLPVDKQLAALDAHCRHFIAHAPFVVLGTQGDVSPKGDAPGFVRVLDDTTLVIPDRKGNNRLDSMGNILDDPKVGLLFMIPGVNETLRVNGRAEISVEPALLARLAIAGQAPRSAIVVHVEEAYLHCAKALERSRLWQPEAQVPKGTIPPAGHIFADQTGGDPATMARGYDERVAADMVAEGRGPAR